MKRVGGYVREHPLGRRPVGLLAKQGDFVASWSIAILLVGVVPPQGCPDVSALRVQRRAVDVDQHILNRPPVQDPDKRPKAWFVM